MTVTDWQISSQTHCGNVRKVNEDSLLVQQHYPLLAVADGMGGHQAGDIASQMLINQLANLSLENELTDAAAQVRQAILTGNADIIDYGKRNLGGQTIGTTVVAMLARGSEGACLWAGDSRLYRYREPDLQQLSEDHSYVGELVKSGQLHPKDARHHPSANVITRTVGVDPKLEVAQLTFHIAPRDTFLLCSDGLYNEASNTELQQAMSADDIYRASDQLLNLCLHRAARDNISFIIARALDDKTPILDATLTVFSEDV